MKLHRKRVEKNKSYTAMICVYSFIVFFRNFIECLSKTWVQIKRKTQFLQQFILRFQRINCKLVIQIFYEF